jgi:glycosyltransferase involved in cell wall biosynthesis
MSLVDTADTETLTDPSPGGAPPGRADRRPRVVAMILAYNVERLLEKALRKIPPALVDDIFVMDDGSTDGTNAVARRLGLRVYRNERNLGYGGNVRAGLRRAVDDHDADYVVEIHGDGAQFNPEAIAAAVPLMSRGVPFILGSRFVQPGRARKNGMSLVRFLANKGLSALARQVLRLPLTEFHSGFRLYARSLVDTLPLEANASDHLFSFEILVQAAYHGIDVREVPVEADYLSEHTSISLREAVIYSFDNLLCLGKFLLAKLGLRHGRQFPRRAAAAHAATPAAAAAPLRAER